jgi:hypothetical protein
MQAMLDHDQRDRPSHGGARHLPVLFHLMDVSRPKRPEPQVAAIGGATQPKGAEPASKFEIASEQEEVTASASENESVTLSSSGAAARFQFTPPPVAVASLAPSPAVVPATEQTIQPPTPAISSPFAPDASTTWREIEANSNTVSAPAEAPITIVEATIVNEPVARPVPPIAATTDRLSQRKVRRAASEDWFASHGKFIAIAFVLALLGTIYFARTSRRQPVASAEGKMASAEPAEQGKKAYDSRPVDRTSSYRLTSNSAGESGTSQGESPTSSHPMTELHPPSMPQLAAGDAAGDKSSKSDNLFVFPTKKGEDRMAVRPDAATNTTSPIPGSTSVQAEAHGASPPGTSSVGATSELTPAYPTTSQPAAPQASSPSAGAYPVTGAPPLGAAAAPSLPAMNPPNASTGAGNSGYSAPNYRSQYPAATGFTPPAASAWSPPAAAAAAPSPYQPPDNTARGQRYERTGSGNY